MIRERINIYQIAEEAGVSPATVSRVMTNNARVSAEKRKKVEAAIQKYGYSPNALAKGLSSARTNTIGLLIADISGPFYSTVATACEKAAREKDYMLMMLSSLSDYSLELEQMQKLYEQRVDAILVVGGRIDQVAQDEEYLNEMNRMGELTPIVSTGRLIGTQNARVCLDEIGSMKLAMEYLTELGHKKIALVGGHKEIRSTFDKQETYRIMLEERGIPFCPEYVEETWDYNSAQGYEAAKKLLSLTDRPTAVIAINDHTGAGVLRAAADLGLSVPEDLSVISFDNTYLSEAVTPRMTAVGCDYEEFGKTLVDAAIRASNGEKQEKEQTVPVRLYRRDSCRAI